jgi:hypothetical protein
MNNTRDRRSIVARVGYLLVSLSILLAAILWSKTCAFGGFHCFAGAYGHVMAGAQLGVIFGLLGSMFGRGLNRLLFGVIAIVELTFCYLRLLVH